MAKRVPLLSGVNLVVKRAFDLVVGIPLTLIALPVLAIGALAIKLDSPGPAVYCQTRVGMHGQTVYSVTL